MEITDKVIFRRVATKHGNSSIGMTLPQEIIEYLEIREGDEIGLVADLSKHGRFAGVWNESKQKQTKLKLTKN